MFRGGDFTICLRDYVVSVMQDDAQDTYVTLFSDAKIMRCIGPVLTPESAMQHFAVAKRVSNRKFTTQLYLSIKTLTTEKVAGIFSAHVTTLDKSAEVGIMLLRQYHSIGLAQQVVGAMCNCIFAKYDIKNVVCRISQDNLAAQKIVAKLGFVKKDSSEWYELERVN